jgi:hypothetical protein
MTGHRLTASSPDCVVFQFSTSASTPFFWLGWENRASWVIRLFSHSPFSHVDIRLPDGTLLGASDQGPNSPYVKGNPCGVAIRPSDYQKFGIRRQMVIQTDKANAIIGFCTDQLGKPFDKGMAHNFLSPSVPGVRDWRNPESWACSEMTTCATEESAYWLPILGKKQLPWPKNRVSPTDKIMIFLLDPNWINRDTFWDPIEGLKLDLGEV